MSRLTVRLPETLHHQLAAQAQREGVSLNQYIVYALTRQVALPYTVHAAAPEEVRQQQAQFTDLLSRLGPASAADLQQALAAREVVEPDSGLTPEVVARVRQRLAGERSQA